MKLTYTLIEGDCLKAMAELDKDSVDLVLTSPPYAGASMWLLEGETIEEEIVRLDALNEAALTACTRVLKPNGFIAWNTADIACGNLGFSTNSAKTVNHATKLGLIQRGDIIWDKGISYLPPPCFMRRPCIPNITYEHILVFVKGDWVPRDKKIVIPHEVKQWSVQGVWKMHTESATTMKHIAPYPTELAERCVKLFSLEEDIILDPFLGSGTTMFVAQDFKRNCIGVELLPEYVEQTKKRCFGRTFLDRECHYEYRKI